MTGMDRSALLASYKSSLLDAAKAFTGAADADFIRHLDTAAADMHRIRPRTQVGSLSLVAGETAYPAPDDMVRYKSAIWGMSGNRLMPWDKGYPGALPHVRLVDDGAGKILSFSFAPTPAQFAAFGTAYRYYYFAMHRIGSTDAETTIAAGDRHLLIMRAQAEAMKELAMRDSVRPVQIGGNGSPAKTGLPSAIWESLMTSWLLSAT